MAFPPARAAAVHPGNMAFPPACAAAVHPENKVFPPVGAAAVCRYQNVFRLHARLISVPHRSARQSAYRPSNELPFQKISRVRSLAPRLRLAPHSALSLQQQQSLRQTSGYHCSLRTDQINPPSLLWKQMFCPVQSSLPPRYLFPRCGTAPSPPASGGCASPLLQHGQF